MTKHVILYHTYSVFTDAFDARTENAGGPGHATINPNTVMKYTVVKVNRHQGYNQTTGTYKERFSTGGEPRSF